MDPVQRLNGYVTAWSHEVGGSPEELLRVQAKTEVGPNGPEFTRELVLQDPGHYLFIAVALDETKDIDLWLFEGEGLIARDVSDDSYPLFSGPLPIEGKLRVRLAVTNAEAEFLLAVFRIPF